MLEKLELIDINPLLYDEEKHIRICPFHLDLEMIRHEVVEKHAENEEGAITIGYHCPKCHCHTERFALREQFVRIFSKGGDINGETKKESDSK